MKRLKVLLVALVLSIFLVSSAQAVDYGVILSAETRTGSIANPAQTDSYTFNGDIGQTVLINMSRESGGLNPMIDLYDPAGILETSVNCGDDSSGSVQCTNVLISNHQLLQSGLYTIVARDFAGNNAGNYSLSFTKIPGSQSFPAIRLNLNQTEFQTADTLVVFAHITDGPNPVTVEIKIWISLPTGDQISIIDPHFTFTVEPNADFTADIFAHTFSGSEPSGNYNVGGRFLNPISGRELSVNVEYFSFSP